MRSAELSQCSCKVGRAIDKYRLNRLDDDIIHRREQDGDSLRTLADFVNTTILRQAIEKHADSVLADAESIYEKLTDENDIGAKTEIRERLATAGVPIEEVTDDFVSHQTVRAHLKDCLDMETSRPQSTDIDEIANLIEWARHRDEQIINRGITRLHELDKLDMGDPDVIHSIRIICGDCGRSHRLQELLDTGGCECSEAINYN